MSREDKAFLCCLNKNGSEVWNDEYMNFIILTVEWKCKEIIGVQDVAYAVAKESMKI